MSSQTSPPPQEPPELTYQGSRVPWYVWALWIAFFVVFGAYLIVNALPSIRRLVGESRFDTFPF